MRRKTCEDLYVDGRRGVDIRLDGPALRVLRPARADGQFPLQRISRIVVLGCVRWQPEAVNACLREHKPVVELDAYGRFVRILFSPSSAIWPGKAHRRASRGAALL